MYGCWMRGSRELWQPEVPSTIKGRLGLGLLPQLCKLLLNDAVKYGALGPASGRLALPCSVPAVHNLAVGRAVQCLGELCCISLNQRRSMKPRLFDLAFQKAVNEQLGKLARRGEG